MFTGLFFILLSQCWFFQLVVTGRSLFNLVQVFWMSQGAMLPSQLYCPVVLSFRVFTFSVLPLHQASPDRRSRRRFAGSGREYGRGFRMIEGKTFVSNLRVRDFSFEKKTVFAIISSHRLRLLVQYCAILMPNILLPAASSKVRQLSPETWQRL